MMFDTFHNFFIGCVRQASQRKKTRESIPWFRINVLLYCMSCSLVQCLAHNLEIVAQGLMPYSHPVRFDFLFVLVVP